MYNNDDPEKVQTIDEAINLKKYIGASYITGYLMGTGIGLVSYKPGDSFGNTITRYNRYFGDYLVISGGLFYGLNRLKHFLNDK